VESPGPPQPADASFEFGKEPDAPKRARRAVRELVDDPCDPIADAVTLAASELVANVIQHTSDGGTMRAWDPKPDVPLRLEVEDHDPLVPQPATPGADQVSGRGLKIVDGVADAWGVEPTAQGKVVWAEFDRNERSSRAESAPREEDTPG
jgi:anti-sigma regulatory factor (Ser/Thr protein kinase)